MSQNRSERLPQQGVGLPVAVELLRQGNEAGKPQGEGKEEHKIPLFWRVFGGTVLSIASLVAMTAYNGVASSLAGLQASTSQLETEMRKEMARLNEMHGELVRKEECTTRIHSVWMSISELQEDRKELLKLKEQCASLAARLKQGGEQRRRLRQEIDGLREQQAAEQERRALVGELVQLRERLAGIEARQKFESAALPVFLPKDDRPAQRQDSLR